MSLENSAPPIDYSMYPAGPAPLGVESNFINPESRAVEAHIGMGISMGLSAFFVLLRVYVKTANRLKWTLDDGFLGLSWISMAIHNAISIWEMQHKTVGVHIWDIRATAIGKRFGAINVSAFVLFAVAALTVKLSLLLLYLSLFGVDKRTRYLVHGGITVFTLFYSATIIVACIIWIPRSNRDVDASWAMALAKYADQGSGLTMSQGVFGTVSDIYLLIIPLQCIAQLHMSRGRRWGVASIFMVGIVAIACSVGTLVVRVQNFKAVDGTWGSLPVYIFSGAEVSAGMICASLPVCAPVFAFMKKIHIPSIKYFSRMTGSTTRNRSNSSYMNKSSEMYPIPDSSSQDVHLTGHSGRSMYTASRGDDVNSIEMDGGIYVKREFGTVSQTEVRR